MPSAVIAGLRAYRVHLIARGQHAKAATVDHCIKIVQRLAIADGGSKPG